MPLQVTAPLLTVEEEATMPEALTVPKTQREGIVLVGGFEDGSFGGVGYVS